MTMPWPERLWRLFDDTHDSAQDALRVGRPTAFGEVQTAEFYPLIELDSSNGLSVLRDIQTVTGSGSISESQGQYVLSTGATSGSTARLDTAERGRYQPGVVGLPGIGIQRPVAPTGNQFWEAGYFSDNDGLRFGEDSTGLYVRLRVGGVDKDKVYQADMNGDPLDGTGGSGLTLDLTKPTVFRMPFVWYFGGPGLMEALALDANNKPQLIVMHRFGQTANEPFIEQPKQPIRAFVSNGGDASNLDVYVGGRQFAVVGRYAPNRRETAAERIALSTTTTRKPLVSFRKKSDYKSISKSTKISGLAIAADIDTVFEILVGGIVSGGSGFGSVPDVPDAETAMEVNITATTITGGQMIDKTVFSGGSGNRTNTAGIRRLGLDIPDDTAVTLTARTVAGAGEASGVFTIEEEW